ncbi:MAG: iron chaperone [Bacteroidia bacterium]
MKTKKYLNVDDYLLDFPSSTQMHLNEIRKTIAKAAPKATEGISYNMPSYKFNGKPVVYYAGYKNHIGLYATPSGHAEFSKELSKYKHGKGSVQFPLDEKMPLALISKIVKFRIEILKGG